MLEPAPPTHAVRTSLTGDQYTALLELKIALGSETSYATVPSAADQDRLCEGLIRVENKLNILIDVDEAHACPNVAALLALIQAKRNPDQQLLPRPGHVEVFDLPAYRAAIGRPIRAWRFKGAVEAPVVIPAEARVQPPEEPTAPREPDLVLDPAIVAAAEGRHDDPPQGGIARQLVSWALMLAAMLLAASALIPPPMPVETPAQIALRDAVR